MQILTIGKLEDAINACIRANPQSGPAISAPARAFADIYGFMIYEKLSEIDFSNLISSNQVGEKHINAVNEFYDK